MRSWVWMHRSDDQQVLQAAANEFLRQLGHWKGNVANTQYTVFGPTPSGAFVHSLCITYESSRQLGLNESEPGDSTA